MRRKVENTRLDRGDKELNTQLVTGFVQNYECN